VLHREGEALLFEDPELAGLHAATIHIVRVALDGLPRDLGTGPMEGIDMYALVDPDSQWALAQASLDLLGTHLSDTAPFGGMRLSPPVAFDSRVLLRLQVLVPADAVGELRPRLAFALETMVREVLGPDALAVFSTEPTDDEDEASPEDRDAEPSGRGHPEEVAAWIASADQVTVLTGAGISTESGIPDFRGPNGVWTKDPSAVRLADIDSYLASSELRQQAWQERLHHPAWEARPNAGHRALVHLERAGKLRALITQNIDGLHQAAGSSPERVLELHGTIHRCRCLECGYETPMQEQLDRVRAGELDPPCARCGGIQRSATVAFGQSLDPTVLRAARAAAEACDVFLVVGTSLRVSPASHLCADALRAGARLVIVNAEPTEYDRAAAAVLRGPIGDVLPAIVGAPPS